MLFKSKTKNLPDSKDETSLSRRSLLELGGKGLAYVAIGHGVLSACSSEGTEKVTQTVVETPGTTVTNVDSTTTPNTASTVIDTSTSEIAETTATSTTSTPEVIILSPEQHVFEDQELMGSMHIPAAEDVIVGLYANVLTEEEKQLQAQQNADGQIIGTFVDTKTNSMMDTLGAAQWPGTVNPGELGNSVFGGHNQSHSHPFRGLDLIMSATTAQKLSGDPTAKGDEMIITQPGGTQLIYEAIKDGRVDGDNNILTDVTDQSQLEKYIYSQEGAKQAGESWVTLYTCYPDGTSDTRRAVVFKLVNIISPPAQ